MKDHPLTPEWVEETEDRETVYWRARVEEAKRCVDRMRGLAMDMRAATPHAGNKPPYPAHVVMALVIGALLGGAMGLVIGAGILVT